MRTKGDMIAHALKHAQAKDLRGFFCDAVRCGTIVGVGQSEQLLLEWVAGKVEQGEPLVPRLAKGKRRGTHARQESRARPGPDTRCGPPRKSGLKT